MKKNSFTEQDYTNTVSYLNIVAKNAKFTMDTPEIITYFKLLSKMQQEILPKIKDHIFEIKSITKPKDDF